MKENQERRRRKKPPLASSQKGVMKEPQNNAAFELSGTGPTSVQPGSSAENTAWMLSRHKCICIKAGTGGWLVEYSFKRCDNGAIFAVPGGGGVYSVGKIYDLHQLAMWMKGLS